MPDRVIGQPALRVPGRRVTVQSGNPAGLFGLQAGAEQVGEQVVVTPPAAHLIQRHHEQPGPLGLLQQRLAARTAGDHVTQRAAAGPAPRSPARTRAPEPRQAQRRVAAACQRQVQPRRPVLEQEPERGVHRLRADHVIVIQDQQQRLVRVRPAGHLVDQRRHQRLERRRRRRPEQRAHPLADPRPHPVQRGHRMPPEPGRVVVAGIQRQPRRRQPAAPDPLGQQDRLAVPGRPADQDQPASPALVEPFRQPRARHQTGPQPGHVQLGGQQDIALRRSGRGCGRLTHR